MYAQDFTDWLNDELIKRDWSQADLSRASGLTTAAISKIMSGERGLGKKSANAIALALKLSPEEISRRAGLLPPKHDTSPTFEEANYLLNQLTEDDQRMVIGFMRVIAERREKYDENSGKPLEKAQQY